MNILLKSLSNSERVPNFRPTRLHLKRDASGVQLRLVGITDQDFPLGGVYELDDKDTARSLFRGVLVSAHVAGAQTTLTFTERTPAEEKRRVQKENSVDITPFVFEKSVTIKTPPAPSSLRLTLQTEWIQKNGGFLDLGTCLAAAFQRGKVNSLNPHLSWRSTTGHRTGYTALQARFERVTPPSTGALDLYPTTMPPLACGKETVVLPRYWFRSIWKLLWDYEQKRIERLTLALPLAPCGDAEPLALSLKVQDIETLEGFSSQRATLADDSPDDWPSGLATSGSTEHERRSEAPSEHSQDSPPPQSGYPPYATSPVSTLHVPSPPQAQPRNGPFKMSSPTSGQNFPQETLQGPVRPSAGAGMAESTILEKGEISCSPVTSSWAHPSSTGTMVSQEENSSKKPPKEGSDTKEPVSDFGDWKAVFENSDFDEWMYHPKDRGEPAQIHCSPPQPRHVVEEKKERTLLKVPAGADLQKGEDGTPDSVDTEVFPVERGSVSSRTENPLVETASIPKNLQTSQTLLDSPLKDLGTEPFVQPHLKGEEQDFIKDVGSHHLSSRDVLETPSIPPNGCLQSPPQDLSLEDFAASFLVTPRQQQEKPLQVPPPASRAKIPYEKKGLSFPEDASEPRSKTTSRLWSRIVTEALTTLQPELMTQFSSQVTVTLPFDVALELYIDQKVQLSFEGRTLNGTLTTIDLSSEGPRRKAALTLQVPPDWLVAWTQQKMTLCNLRHVAPLEGLTERHLSLHDVLVDSVVENDAEQQFAKLQSVHLPSARDVKKWIKTHATSITLRLRSLKTTRHLTHDLVGDLIPTKEMIV